MVSSGVPAWQAVGDALEDFFTKKKSRLSSATVKALLRSVPSPAWLGALIEHARGARSDFLKAEALQLLPVALQPAQVGLMSSSQCGGVEASLCVT